MTIDFSIRKPLLIGFATIIPFVVMEIVNRWSFSFDFPFFLFLVLWLSASFCIGMLMTAYKSFHGARMLKFALSVILLAAVFTFWLLIVADQMPCFLGVENCD